MEYHDRFDYSLDEFVDETVDQLTNESGSAPDSLLRQAHQRLIGAITGIRGGATQDIVSHNIYQAELLIRQASQRIRSGPAVRQLDLARRSIAAARREQFRSLAQGARLRGAIWHIQAALRQF